MTDGVSVGMKTFWLGDHDLGAVTKALVEID
jgi:hypothetical protein